MPYLHLRTPVVPAKLLNQAGIIGAALYARNARKQSLGLAKWTHRCDLQSAVAIDLITTASHAHRRSRLRSAGASR